MFVCLKLIFKLSCWHSLDVVIVVKLLQPIHRNGTINETLVNYRLVSVYCPNLQAPSNNSNSGAKALFTLFRFRNRLLVAPNHSIFHLLVRHRKNRMDYTKIRVWRFSTNHFHGAFYYYLRSLFWLTLINQVRSKQKIKWKLLVYFYFHWLLRFACLAFVSASLVESIFGIVTRRMIKTARLISSIL